MTTLHRLRKLRAMEPGEIVHRLRYSVFLANERRAHARGVLGAAQNGLEPHLRPDLRGTGWRERLLAARASSSARFFPSVTSPEPLRSCLSRDYPSELADMRERASAARAHRFTFFGQTFAYDGPVSWHDDPVSGVGWPFVFHADVPAEGGDRGFGDIKYAWELNRHQFLVDLARAAFVDKSSADAEALNRLHRSWMDACPYGTGVPWACALEPAFRVFTWVWCYHLLCGAGLMTDDDDVRWLNGLHDHGHFLHRHLERWASPYNHLAGEASALYQLGVLFPEFAEAPRWRERGRAALEESLVWQFHADGGSVEQSTFYHHATVGFYLLAALLGRFNGEEYSPEAWTAIERGLEFSLHMRWPDGFTPSIGGGDDGKPIRMQHLPFWDFRYYLAVGAVLFDRGDFKHAAGRFWEDALWLLGTEGRERFEAMPSAVPDTRRWFRHSGYVTARSDWSPSADFACFDCGPQAGGLRRDDVPSAAHGHADCLSLLVALGGRRVLVDPGFYCYNCKDGWEVHFRKTHVHNTLTLDGLDQAQHLSKMAWSRTYTPTWGAVSFRSDLTGFAGSHDGFSRARHPYVHRRHVWLTGAGRLVILDVLEGHGPCSFIVNFQFAPGELEQLSGSVARFDGRFDLAWASPHASEMSLECGGTLPSGGWIAESLGVKRAAPRLRVSGSCEESSTVLVSVLVDTVRVGDGASHLPGLERAIANAGSALVTAGPLRALLEEWAS